MQVVTLNSVHSSSPAEDSATTWALPPTLDATNITNTSVLLTAAFPDLATPIQQVVLQQVRVCAVLYVIMEVGREAEGGGCSTPSACCRGIQYNIKYRKGCAAVRESCVLKSSSTVACRVSAN